MVELGCYPFLDPGVLPTTVAALLHRRGIGGFSTRLQNRCGERIVNDENDPTRAYEVRQGRRHILSLLIGLNQSEGFAISDAGDIVGTIWENDMNYTAVLWRRGQVYDLSAHVVSGTVLRLAAPGVRPAEVVYQQEGPRGDEG